MLDTFRMTLSEYLKESGNTAAEFAEIIGVSQEAVRMWLRGERRPRFEHLEAIAEATSGRVLPNDFMVKSRWHP